MTRTLKSRLHDLVSRLRPRRLKQPELQGWAKMLNPRKIRVLIGPMTHVIRYAQAKRWRADEVHFITDVLQLRQLDPAAIERIIHVKARSMGKSTYKAVRTEVEDLRALWNEIPVEHAVR